jgi:hypothetical protein
LRILAIALLLCVPSLAQESAPAPQPAPKKEGEDFSTYDFQSYTKPNKLNARLMLKMQNDINQKTLPSPETTETTGAAPDAGAWKRLRRYEDKNHCSPTVLLLTVGRR